MRLLFTSKILFAILLFVFACEDLPRDNVLDPKNPDSYTATVPLIEAFVNLAHPAPYNQWAIQSLNNLSQLYDGKINVVEYHRDITVDSVTYDDPYNTPEAQTLFRLLQDRYVSSHPEIPRSVPDVYLNGADERFTGAYDVQSLKKQIEPELLELLSRKNFYRLEPKISRSGGLSLDVSCKVAVLGNNDGNNLRLRIIFVKKRVQENLTLNTVVKLIWPGLAVDKIENGDFTEVEAGSFTFKESEMPDGAVFALTSEDESIVFQSIYAAF
ncbi:MAG: hypothetical protein GXO77_09510 [Calditrichaeota bacterium]|nr:hypothetical protein [Calditrichota bacterium]